MGDLAAENTNPHPLEIVDARQAQRSASETQTEHLEALAEMHEAVARAELCYRVAVAQEIRELKKTWPATVCKDLARGDALVSELAYERDVLAGDLAELEEHSYRLAADRRALDGLIDWSKQKELRIETPPGDGDWETFGRGAPPPGVDPSTGEIRRVA